MSAGRNTLKDVGWLYWLFYWRPTPKQAAVFCVVCGVLSWVLILLFR